MHKQISFGEKGASDLVGMANSEKDLSRGSPTFKYNPRMALKPAGELQAIDRRSTQHVSKRQLSGVDAVADIHICSLYR